MPALPNVPKVLRLVFTGAAASDVDVINRVYIQYTGTAPLASDLNTFTNTVDTAWIANLRSLTPNAYSLHSVSATDLTSPTAAFGQTVSVNAGTRGTTELPVGSCFVISHELNRRYRGGHPRTYWYWGIESDLATANTWASAFSNAVATGWTAFVTAVLAGGWTGAGTLSHVNVSYYKGFTSVQNPVTLRWRNVPTVRAAPAVDLVASYAYRPYVGSQRRRNEARP